MNDMSTRSALQMSKIFVAIGLACHFLCCVWVAIGRQGYDEGLPNWLAADQYLYPEGLRSVDTEGSRRTTSVYIAAYYYCFTTITSVGYGDLHPRNDQERVFAIILEAVGGFLYAIIIASLTSIVTSQDSNKRAIAERLDMVSSYVTCLHSSAQTHRSTAGARKRLPGHGGGRQGALLPARGIRAPRKFLLMPPPPGVSWSYSLFRTIVQTAAAQTAHRVPPSCSLALPGT
jgi:hypothetical protein